MGSRAKSEAFERAVREHHAAVYRTALRVLGDESLALDAVQQTFVALLQGKLALEEAEDPARLLRCVAAREAAMLLRSERARARRQMEVAMRRTESDEHDEVGQREVLRELRRSLGALPEELRNAIALRYQEGLTLAEVGRALGISEPSAHGRVQRGLERLRERLTLLGFAAAVPSLPALLTRDEPAPVPPHVESTLLGLARGALAGASLGAIVAGAVAVLALAATVTAVVATRDPEARGTAAAAAVPAPVADESVSASKAEAFARARVEAEPTTNAPQNPWTPQEEVRFEDGILAGQVVDEFGLPLEGVTVDAASVEHHTKMAEFSGSTVTARDGSFRLSLPVTLATGQDYTLTARTASLVQDAGIVRVRPGRTTSSLRVQMFAEVLDRPGAWRLWLTLRDEAGRPVSGASARVHWVVRNPAGVQWTNMQASALTESDGAATLHGEGLGPKLLTIDARSQGLAPMHERIAIDVAGDTQREVVLSAGLEITGTMVDDEGAPVTIERIGRSTVSLYATAADRNQWYRAELVEPGRFRIQALAPVAHELHFHHERWSSFTLCDVVPGAGVLALQLKRKDDPRDFGNHAGEIHGELIDAATGEPVPTDALTTWLERIADHSPALDDGDFAPLVVEGVIAQTATFDIDDEQLPPAPPPNAFVYDDLQPGLHAVRVRAHGYAPTLVGPLELGERQIESGLVVRLARGASVEGLVRDERGAPLANAFVLPLGSGELSRAHVEALDREVRSKGGRGFIGTSAARTDAGGRFTLEHVPTDRALHLVALEAEHEPVHGAPLVLGEARSSSGHELRFGPRRER